MAEIVSLAAAIGAAIHDGDTVAMEGFTHLIPHAAGREVIRQGRRDLTLIRMTPDIIYDQLIGAGCARKLVFSWGGNPGVGSLHRFRDAYENGWPGPLEIEEHSHAGMANRYAAGQVDRLGNINTTVIGGDYARPAVRLPGAGGAPEIAGSCREVTIVLRQSPRALVERVDFVTSVGFGDGPGARQRLGLTGAGPRRIITDLGVLEPDPGTLEFVLTGVYPGVSVSEVTNRTGWELGVAADLAELPAPGPAELAALRALTAVSVRRGGEGS